MMAASPRIRNALTLFSSPDCVVCHRGETQGRCIEGFEIPEAQKGKLSAAEFDAAARDISAFLAYTGEPAAIRRNSMGVWVVLFLAFFTLLAYLLKLEYWRDVH